MLVAGIPGGCNLADHQVEHSQDVAGNPSVLEPAGSFQVLEDNQSPVGQLEHNVTFPQFISIKFFTCGCINSFQHLFIYLHLTMLSVPWTTQHQSEGARNNAMKRMQNYAVMDCYDELLQHLNEQTEKKPEKCNLERLVSRQDMYLGPLQI